MPSTISRVPSLGETHLLASKPRSKASGPQFWYGEGDIDSTAAPRSRRVLLSGSPSGQPTSRDKGPKRSRNIAAIATASSRRTAVGGGRRMLTKGSSRGHRVCKRLSLGMDDEFWEWKGSMLYHAMPCQALTRMLDEDVLGPSSSSPSRDMTRTKDYSGAEYGSSLELWKSKRSFQMRFHQISRFRYELRRALWRSSGAGSGSPVAPIPSSSEVKPTSFTETVPLKQKIHDARDESSESAIEILPAAHPTTPDLISDCKECPGLAHVHGAATSIEANALETHFCPINRQGVNNMNFTCTTESRPSRSLKGSENAFCVQVSYPSFRCDDGHVYLLNIKDTASHSPDQVLRQLLRGKAPWPKPQPDSRKAAGLFPGQNKPFEWRWKAVKAAPRVLGTRHGKAPAALPPQVPGAAQENSHGVNEKASKRLPPPLGISLLALFPDARARVWLIDRLSL
ncbi:hypothetical protein B0H66DRAFT_538197 [Apodospora peruviana]|uniref:Uncharacterized protein n=1 Tax=Apodospora peruviana TaxID=516989 RepID=A0AAE0HW99_9PEZI|nr:hypothetical protein B0H66DRAFT_538197 [Apodospora peruviana]